MKKIYLIILCLSMFLACQVEEDLEIINNSTALNGDSQLTDNLRRLTQNPTAFDNFIDGSSKIRVEFPAQLTINNEINFSLNSTEDYSSLIEILENTPARDMIALNFPFNVSTIDYRVETLNSSEELDQLLETAQESSEVNCVELSYPIDVQFFNASSTFVDTRIFVNEPQFFNFLDEVKSNNLFYQLDYPVGIFVDAGPDQQFETFVNSNDELTSIYQDLFESCFEPLLYNNNPSNNNPTNLEQFVQFITNGTFIISELIDEGEQDNTYNNLQFNFSLVGNFEGAIIVDQGTIGDWSAYIDDGVIIFDLSFEESFYDELEEDWDVLNYDETDLVLQDISSDGDTSSLTFSKVN